MIDRVSKEARSRIMSAIRAKDTETTEKVMARLLRRDHIIGWRRQWVVIGKPDFAWPKEKVALFVDGCFWHGCPRCYKAPQSNSDYWREKILRNKARDRKVSRALRGHGWIVLRVWECRVSDARTVSRIASTVERRRNFSFSDQDRGNR